MLPTSDLTDSAESTPISLAAATTQTQLLKLFLEQSLLNLVPSTLFSKVGYGITKILRLIENDVYWKLVGWMS